MNKDFSNIYWFTSEGLHSPSTRYRAFYPFKYFSEIKPSGHVFFYPKRTLLGFVRYFFVFLKALFDRNGLIFIQKVCSNKYYAKSLKLLVKIKKVNTFYDFDDAEYLRGEASSLNFFLRNVEYVTVGSNALKEYSKKFSKNVRVLTSPIKPHNNKKKMRNRIITIGWVGDTGNGDALDHPFSHKRSLYEYLFPAIKSINDPMKLVLIGVKNKEDREEMEEYFKDKSNFELEIPVDLEWEDDDWLYSDIAEFDIGVSPMVNHPFNEAKSAFKAKQYLSCGVPVIASDVGDTNQFILEGQNGFLVDNWQGFEKAIRRIVNMSDREYLGLSTNCLNSREDFSLENYCKNLFKKIS